MIILACGHYCTLYLSRKIRDSKRVEYSVLPYLADCKCNVSIKIVLKIVTSIFFLDFFFSQSRVITPAVIDCFYFRLPGRLSLL